MIKMNVLFTLNAYQLAALMRDGGEIYFNDGGEYSSDFELVRNRLSGRDYNNPRHIRGAVRAALRENGEGSVNCGPRHEWSSSDEERWYLRQVCRTFELDMPDGV